MNYEYLTKGVIGVLIGKKKSNDSFIMSLSHLLVEFAKRCDKNIFFYMMFIIIGLFDWQQRLCIW